MAVLIEGSGADKGSSRAMALFIEVVKNRAYSGGGLSRAVVWISFIPSAILELTGGFVPY